MRTETFAAHFEPHILRLVGLLDLRWPTKYETLVSTVVNDSSIADGRRSLQIIWKPGFTNVSGLFTNTRSRCFKFLVDCVASKGVYL